MKPIAVHILILLLIGQTFSSWLTVAVFKVNRDYIAKNICENRNRPVLNCKGNCMLMKKLKQEQRDEKSSSGPLKAEISFLVLSSRSFYPLLHLNEPAAGMAIYTHPTSTGRPVDRALSVFHPPAA